MYLLSHPFKNSKPDLIYRVTFFIYSCIFVTLSILLFQPKHFYFWPRRASVQRGAPFDRVSETNGSAELSFILDVF